MVTDFQGSFYNTNISYFDLIYSDLEDEMKVWILDYISELKLGIKRNMYPVSLAMCIYDTLLSISGDPAKDHLTYEQMNNLIYNFNKLTNSTVTINFR